MTTPTGAIGLSDVNAELGYSPTALINMNDSAVRTLAGVGGSGTIISMDDLRGKSNRVAMSLVISGNTYNYNVYTAASSQPTYISGNTDVTVTVDPGVVVGSTSTGTYAFSVPSSFDPGDTVTIVNNGVIQGMGGSGGKGGRASGPTPGRVSAVPGSTGGSAALIQRPVTFTNNGTIAGGGGGGGGGGWGVSRYSAPEIPTRYALGGGGGGGGGAGYNGGTGGAAGGVAPPAYSAGPGTAGSPGTSPAGGGGGAGGPAPFPYPPGPARGGNGGAGGGRGGSGSTGAAGTGPYARSPGAPGAGPGPYMVGLPYVSWPATGTRLGPSS